MRVLIVIALIFASAYADLYLHNMRGSNNCVDDNNNAPANRLFNSQNNGNHCLRSGLESGAEPMKFYAGSEVRMEWSVQHACGEHPNTNCNMVLQYRCDGLMRDGTSRNQPEEDVEEPSADRGRHEPISNWDLCKERERNKGLFTADQNPGNNARATRQNPGGNRSGYECAEERDYYPYWHPTEWLDIAVLTDDVDNLCEYYQENSQNVLAKNYCELPPDSGTIPNNEIACQNNDPAGTWMSQDSFGIEAPVCEQTAWTNENSHHFLAIMPDGEATSMAYYNWELPATAASVCVFRIRYNMTTNDYDGWTTDFTSNGNLSPIEDDPTYTIPYGTEGATRDLQMDIDTAQFGRVFQDRTHTFEVLERPNEIPANTRIYNLNVRGKRGNNQQTYPDVEYLYSPETVQMATGEYVHVQWTGSNNNPQGTDRHNLVQVANLNLNMPMAFDTWTLSTDREYKEGVATNGGSNDPNLQDQTPYYNAGLLRMDTAGTYHFLDTKNNAYSNRAQKGTIEVGQGSETLVIVLASVGGGIAALGGIVLIANYLRNRGGSSF